jgi:hypothetical protein
MVIGYLLLVICDGSRLKLCDGSRLKREPLELRVSNAHHHFETRVIITQHKILTIFSKNISKIYIGKS